MTDETARVLHAIEHLGRGGAEAYVITLATEESRRGCRSVVIAREGDLTPKGVNFVSVPSGLRYAGWYSRAWAAHKANRFRLIVVHSIASGICPLAPHTPRLRLPCPVVQEPERDRLRPEGAATQRDRRRFARASFRARKPRSAKPGDSELSSRPQCERFNTR